MRSAVGAPPLVRLFVALSAWLEAVTRSTGREPEIHWAMRRLPGRWRLIVIIDSDEVFCGESSNDHSLACEAERAFRRWEDERSRKENEARLLASVTDMRRP